MSTPSIIPPSDYAQAPTVAQFLADYPKFDTSNSTDLSAVTFGTDALNYWLVLATQMMGPNQSLWGNLYYTGVELFMAHNLALEARAEQGGNQTIPGLIVGAVAATASGDVSVTYDTAAGMEMGAGHWNLTVYGLRFLKLMNLIAAGGLQVTGSGCGSNGAWSGPWSGPWPWNFPNPNL